MSDIIDNLNSDKKEIMFKEFEILQTIISRQEEIRMQSRNWYITVITALTVVLFAKDNTLKSWPYFIICLIISLLFLYLELIHRVAESRAIERSGWVECALRNEIPYDGPCIYQKLMETSSINEIIRGLNNVRLYSTYVCIAFTALLVASFK